MDFAAITIELLSFLEPMKRILRSMTRTFTLATAVVLCLVTLQTSLVAQTKYPHVVDDPPLSPQEQLKKFHLPPGFEIQLVAAEPDVHKPMNFNFDAAGRREGEGYGASDRRLQR
jgi:hypothetical protein